jgi:hypothetical protein
MHKRTVQTSFAHDHDRLDEFLETYRRLKGFDFAQAKQAFWEFKLGLALLKPSTCELRGA